MWQKPMSFTTLCFPMKYTQVNLLPWVVHLLLAKMSFIALNVQDVERFISGKQKGDRIREHLRDDKNKNRHKEGSYLL